MVTRTSTDISVPAQGRAPAARPLPPDVVHKYRKYALDAKMKAQMIDMLDMIDDVCRSINISWFMIAISLSIAGHAPGVIPAPRHHSLGPGHGHKHRQVRQEAVHRRLASEEPVRLCVQRRQEVLLQTRQKSMVWNTQPVRRHLVSRRKRQFPRRGSARNCPEI